MKSSSPIQPSLSPVWRGQKVAILGFGREGQAMANYALARGAVVTICDETESVRLGEIGRSWLGKKITWQVGPDYLKGLDQFAVIVRSPGVPLSLLPIVQAKSKGVIIWSLTKEFFQQCPAPIIGVTGTKGKGTTATLIAEMLKLGKKRVHLVGNIGVAAITILPKIKSGDWVVYEMSSFQLQDLEQSPHLSVVLGLSIDHQNYHKTPREYFSAKSHIVRHQHKTDVGIFNVDYPATLAMTEEAAGQIFFTSRRISLEQGVYVSGDFIWRRLGKKLDKIISRQEVALKGDYNLENVVAAVAAASLAGASLAAIRKALKSFSGLPHRLEYVGIKDGIEYWNNSAGSTPETTAGAIQSFNQPIVLMLGGSDKGHAYDELGRAIVASTVKVIIGIGTTAPKMYESVKKVAQSKKQKPPAYVEGGSTMAEMMRAAHKFAKAGDVILLAPGAASFDRFKNYSDRGEQFKKYYNSLT